jgi:hypothetical protein
MIGVEVGGVRKTCVLGYGRKEGPACPGRACTCIGRTSMNGKSCSWTCAGGIDSLMWRACRSVLYTRTCVAEWHAGLTSRVGEVSDGRALICFAPLMKTHAPLHHSVWELISIASIAKCGSFEDRMPLLEEFSAVTH